MQVNPSHQNDPVGQTELVRRRAVPQKSAAEDAASFERSTALNEALAETPDVRPEVVARARALVGDPTYPPEVAIKKISQLLAMKIQSNEVQS